MKKYKSTSSRGTSLDGRTGLAPRIYLAGPDVFYEDASIRFVMLEALCAARQMTGVRPSDGGLSTDPSLSALSVRAVASRIFEANMERIRSCDGVIANVAPFRGQFEPDSGTVFEIGVAIALGKPVAVYTPHASVDMRTRIERLCGAQDMGGDNKAMAGLMKDREFGALIEDFGLPLNLMLACSSSVHVTASCALDHLADRLITRPRPQAIQRTFSTLAAS